MAPDKLSHSPGPQPPHLPSGEHRHPHFTTSIEGEWPPGGPHVWEPKGIRKTRSEGGAGTQRPCSSPCRQRLQRGREGRVFLPLALLALLGLAWALSRGVVSGKPFLSQGLTV